MVGSTLVGTYPTSGWAFKEAEHYIHTQRRVRDDNHMAQQDVGKDSKLVAEDQGPGQAPG
mgnify:CR=1 FL=1